MISDTKQQEEIKYLKDRLNRLEADILDEQVKYAQECLGMLKKPMEEMCNKIVGAYVSNLSDRLTLQKENEQLTAELKKVKTLANELLGRPVLQTEWAKAMNLLSRAKFFLQRLGSYPVHSQAMAEQIGEFLKVQGKNED